MRSTVTATGSGKMAADLFWDETPQLQDDKAILKFHYFDFHTTEFTQGSFLLDDEMIHCIKTGL